MTNYRRLTAAALPLTSLAAIAGIAAPATAQLANVNPAQSGAATLKVLSPRSGDSVGAHSFALDVSFRSRTGSPIVTAELYVDGVRWVKRNLDAPQLKNVLSFDVDATSLEAGSHTFLVKVYDAAGGSAQTETRIQAGVPSGGVSDGGVGPALRFVGPGNGAKVSGTIELSLEAESRNGINPYVSFYVDKQFKVLKNYPPYSYAWDSTTVPNGFHTVEALGYLESSRDTTARRIRVYVDNAGGETKKKTTVTNLAAKPAAPKISAASKISAAAMVAPSATTTEAKATNAKPSVTLDFGIARVSPIAPVARVEAKPAGLHAAVTATPLTDLAPIAPFAPTVSSVAAPRSVRPAAKPVTTTSLIAQSASAANPTIAPANAAPSTTLHAIAKPAPVSATLNLSPVAPLAKLALSAPALIAPQRVSVAAPAPAIPLKARSRHKDKVTNTLTAQADGMMALPVGRNAFERRSMVVAFDGQRIAFDVQPRVEAGIPIAPFRHIFEHTGGQVMWIAKTQIVRAVNADREIVIKVGGKSALVNGQRVTMDKAAFVEKGRTIVPLSFVGQALNVNIKYDPATGHLDITSK